MNKMQNFLIEKMKKGARKISKLEGAPKLMTNEDIDLLLKRMKSVYPEQNVYNGITEQEWNEWTQNMHWVFQMAFSEDTAKQTDHEQLDKWRELTSYFNNIYSTNISEDMLVIDSLAGHFMRHDLLPAVVRKCGKKNLTEAEKMWPASELGPGIGSGCMIAVLTITIRCGIFLFC